MKRNLLITGMLLPIMALMVQGCGKETAESEQLQDYDMEFAVNVAGMSDSDSKAVFNSSDYLKLIFESGDKIKINGATFTLTQRNGKWLALGSSDEMTNSTRDTLLGQRFYCYYGQSPATVVTKGSTPSFSSLGYNNVSFTGNGVADADRSTYKVYEPGIVLTGRTDDSILTFYPSFAVIRVKNGVAAIELNSLQVGFNGDKVIRYCTSLTPTTSYPTVTNPTYLKAVTKKEESHPLFGTTVSYEGEFLKATTSDISSQVDDYYIYHVIVPLASNSVTTDLFFKYKETYNGNTVPVYKKVSNFKLQRGKVYTFDVNAL